MANIHHNTAKRASTFSIDLQDLGNTIEASFKGRVIASGSNARMVLDEAIAEIMSRGTGASENKAPKAVKAPKKAKAVKVEADDEEGDEANEDMIDAEDEGEEGKKVFIKEAYRSAYRQFDDSCGDDFAQFLGSNFKDMDGKFLGREFIAFVAENGIEPGKFSLIADRNAELPHGFMGQARMTLRNRLTAVVRKQGFLLLGGKKHKLTVGAK